MITYLIWFPIAVYASVTVYGYTHDPIITHYCSSVYIDIFFAWFHLYHIYMDMIVCVVHPCMATLHWTRAYMCIDANLVFLIRACWAIDNLILIMRFIFYHGFPLNIYIHLNLFWTNLNGCIGLASSKYKYCVIFHILPFPPKEQLLYFSKL